MSTSLREFLNQRATQYLAERERNRRLVEDWKATVSRLLTQLEKWLGAADPNGLIEHDRSQVEVSEPGLGRYSTDRLNLRAFGKWVGVIPKARKAVRRAAPHQPRAPEQATGRVDITDEIRRYVLYRIGEGEQEQWVVDDTASGTGELQPLTADRFESALLSYFQ